MINKLLLIKEQLLDKDSSFPICINVNLKILPNEICIAVSSSSPLIINKISKSLDEGRYKSQNKTISYQNNFEIPLVNAVYSGTSSGHPLTRTPL